MGKMYRKLNFFVNLFFFDIKKFSFKAYIQPADGQQHTALAKINSEIGWSLLLVDSLSTPFGWLFAKSSASTQSNKNGFELTGGNFTRIVNMHLGRLINLLNSDFIKAYVILNF